MSKAKVRFRVSMAGAVMRHAGDEALVDAAEAKRLIEAGYAEAVESASAVKAGVETARKAVTRTVRGK